MTNLLSKEKREQLEWMNEPDTWTFLEAEGIHIQAQAWGGFL
ncbi:hypothetical protein [Alkalicoccobacillus plakortidis]|nr:hypothetical protein [Alkalicoccobacillus plakortidis]